MFKLLKQSIKLIELTERYETEFDNLHGKFDWNQSSSNRTIAFDWLSIEYVRQEAKCWGYFPQDLLTSFGIIAKIRHFSVVQYQFNNNRFQVAMCLSKCGKKQRSGTRV